jgi:hypothetical protein
MVYPLASARTWPIWLPRRDECDGGGTYDEDSPTSIKNLIEWKVTLNNGVLARDTEQDLVLKPSLYWQQIKEKAEQVVRWKKPCNNWVRADDTTNLSPTRRTDKRGPSSM